VLDVRNQIIETLIEGSRCLAAIGGNDLARVCDNGSTTGNIVNRNRYQEGKKKHHARNGAAVVDIAMTSALEQEADHGRLNGLNTIFGMDDFLEFMVALRVIGINICRLSEDVRMRGK
jgi:hypothetical protein